jgi:transposase
MAWNDWLELVALVRSLDTRAYNGRFDYTDSEILLTHLWAVIHRQPDSWACRRENWPLFVRRIARPSCSRLSRRLRSAEVQELGRALFARLRAQMPHCPLLLIADGKAILVSSHSRDRRASFGCYGLRGYKLHALCDSRGLIVCFRVTPLHTHEVEMTCRMLRELPAVGYVLGDSNYENKHLYRQCDQSGAQLLAPRRAKHRGRGTRKKIERSRRRGIDMLEQSRTGFGPALLNQRRAIERCFGRLEMNYGLTRAPAWVRGLDRVRRWVSAIVSLDLFRAILRQKAAA